MRIATTSSTPRKLLHELSASSRTELNADLTVNSRPALRWHRGSRICDTYDLRITQRCLVFDLGVESTTTFSDARAHPIVRAFENQRAANPIGVRTVGPAAGEFT